MVRKVQNHGERLVKEGHPAVKHIEAYIVAMSTQWAWIMQLLQCLETHFKHAKEYHQVSVAREIFFLNIVYLIVYLIFLSDLCNLSN